MSRHPLTAAERELAKIRVYVQQLIIELETLKDLNEVLQIRNKFWRDQAQGRIQS